MVAERSFVLPGCFIAPVLCVAPTGLSCGFTAFPPGCACVVCAFSGGCLPFDGDCCSTGCWANAAPASASEQPISKLVSFFLVIMFSRCMLWIYSESSLNFPQPRQAEAFTQHRSPTIVRAIA